MIYRVFGVAALLAAAVLVASTFSDVSDAARRLPNRDGVLVAGHDGVDQQMVTVDSDGNISVEFGTSATAFTVGGPAADDAAASGNPVPIGCKHNTTTNAVEDGDISYVNCGTLGDVYISGRVAAAATDSGNPVKVGGVNSTTLPTLTDGQRGNAQLGTRGSLHVTVMGAGQTTGAIALGSAADALSNSSAGLVTYGIPHNFNGTSWDRERGNTDETVLASAARTGTTASSDLTNYNNSGLHLQIEVTAVTDTPSVVCTIQGKASVSSAYYTILATAAITGVSSNIYRVFPGSTVTANVSANDIIPRIWRVNCVHADADSITYSISASLVD